MRRRRPTPDTHDLADSAAKIPETPAISETPAPTPDPAAAASVTPAPARRRRRRRTDKPAASLGRQKVQQGGRTLETAALDLGEKITSVEYHDDDGNWQPVMVEPRRQRRRGAS